jgi:hypothetical protein
MDDQIYLMLGRIEGKLDAVQTTLTAHILDDKKLTERVVGLERWRSYMAGFAAVIGVMGAGLWQMVTGK